MDTLPKGDTRVGAVLLTDEANSVFNSEIINACLELGIAKDAPLVKRFSKTANGILRARVLHKDKTIVQVLMSSSFWKEQAIS